MSCSLSRSLPREGACGTAGAFRTGMDAGVFGSNAESLAFFANGSTKSTGSIQPSPLGILHQHFSRREGGKGGTIFVDYTPLPQANPLADNIGYAK